MSHHTMLYKYDEHSRMDGEFEMIIANTATRASLAIYHLDHIQRALVEYLLSRPHIL